MVSTGMNGPLAVSRNNDDYAIAPLPDGVLHDLQETVHPLDHSCNNLLVVDCK